MEEERGEERDTQNNEDGRREEDEDGRGKRKTKLRVEEKSSR